jgi:hypothetical protein
MAEPILDDVTLRCLGTAPGPRFLRGMMRGDHSVVLVTLKEGQDNDTHWRRDQNSNGHLWTLRCLGNPPPGVDPGFQFIGGSRDGAVIIAPKDQMPDGKPEIWRARPVPGVANAFTLENIALRDVGVANRFLDGRTQNGSVGLAPNTDPPFTGTHWEVVPVPIPPPATGSHVIE